MQVCVLQDSAFQNLGLPRIIAWALVADVGDKFGSLLYTKKNGFSAVARLGVTL